ncbi:MAG TPA: hypothetical protein ENK57_01500 [Polyangiaceae bacterium]|nr:hypothetical protein [Polyangiaceae bacterium]
MIRPRRWLVPFTVAFGLSACGGVTPKVDSPADSTATEPAAVAAPPPVIRDTADQAARIVDAKLRVLLHVDRVKDHPLAPRLVSMKAWGGLLEAAGIDPLEDVDRAFVAAKNARDPRAVIAVAEHHVSEERLRAAIDEIVAGSGPDGKLLPELGVLAAKVKVRGRESVVLAVTPTLLVVTSDDYAKAATALAATGGLPEPGGDEAVRVRAERPSETLKAPRAPRVPRTISEVEATVTMASDGGADVLIVGQSTNPAQAKADASALTEAVDRATTVEVAIVKIRAFDPVTFAAVDDRVEGRRHLSWNELNTLLGFAEMMAR